MSEPDFSKATPRPWELHVHHHINGEFWASIGHAGRGPICDIVGDEGCNPSFQSTVEFRHITTPFDVQKANADLVVHAVNSYDALLARAERAEAERDALREFEEHVRNYSAATNRLKLAEMGLADWDSRPALLTIGECEEAYKRALLKLDALRAQADGATGEGEGQ